MKKDRRRTTRRGVVIESTGKCKLKTHRFGTSDCRKVRRSEREHARASCFASYVMRYATRGTGRFCRERKSYPRVTRALRKSRREPAGGNGNVIVSTRVYTYATSRKLRTSTFGSVRFQLIAPNHARSNVKSEDEYKERGGSKYLAVLVLDYCIKCGVLSRNWHTFACTHFTCII